MALNTLAKQGIKVWIQWVRKHNGSDVNELPNLGSAFQAEGPEPFLPLSRDGRKRGASSSLDHKVEVAKRLLLNQAFLPGARYDYGKKHSPALVAGDRYAN
jgi:hypothetical protein